MERKRQRERHSRRSSIDSKATHTEPSSIHATDSEQKTRGSERNAAFSRQDILHVALHLFKSHKRAALTFKMIEQRTEARELSPTLVRIVGTMVQELLMRRGIQMLVQAAFSPELPMTHVTFPVCAVEREIRRMVSAVQLGVPADLPHCDGALWIAFTDHAVDCLAVE